MLLKLEIQILEQSTVKKETKVQVKKVMAYVAEMKNSILMEEWPKGIMSCTRLVTRNDEWAKGGVISVLLRPEDIKTDPT